MRPSIRIASAAAVSLALLAAGPASAHERYYRGGGSQAGVALAVGALVGLAVGAAVASAPVVYAPAPVAYAPAPVAYAPAPVAYAPPARVSYAAPAVPPGYCYRGDVGGYVPCAPQSRGYYEAPVSYGY